MNILIQGDALEPCGSDLIAQLESLPIGRPVPEGWRVLTGNARTSLIARVALRSEAEEESGK